MSHTFRKPIFRHRRMLRIVAVLCLGKLYRDACVSGSTALDGSSVSLQCVWNRRLVFPCIVTAEN